MNDIKTSTLLALAAAAVVTAACDPYPKAPGGSPSVLRVVASGPTSEQRKDGPFADQNAIVVDDAVLNDSFYVWFNKQMDGSTIQALPDTSPNSCNVAGSPLATKAGVPADARICYASGSAQGGGLIQVTPSAPPPAPALPVPENFWNVGSYVVGGTVRDYQGNPMTFQATFNVTHFPVLIEPDSYTIDLGWANDPTATGFNVELLKKDTDPVPADVWTNVGANVQWQVPVVQVTGNNSIHRVTGLQPNAIYWFRVVPIGATTPAPSTPASIEMAGPPNVLARANPVIGSGPAADTAQISVARIRGASYRIEQTTDVASDTPVWVTSTGPFTNPAGATVTNPTSSTANPLIINIAGLTNGASYKFRLVPAFGGVDGTPTNASGTVTIDNP